MTGEERRERILDLIRGAKKPRSGTALAEECQVSRQVVVQDIALLRAAGHPIFSTTRGYLLEQPVSVSRVFQVKHTDSQIEDELNTIVDMGGFVRDVYVEHGVYGKLQAELSIGSRRQVLDFLEQIRSKEAHPLNNLTSGEHCHTVEADSEQILDIIGQALKEKGYLVEK